PARTARPTIFPYTTLFRSGRGRDPHQARPQAEDGSAGRATDPEFAAGRSFPADLGAELGEPGSAATAVAPAPHGAGPHPHHEPRSEEHTSELQSPDHLVCR